MRRAAAWLHRHRRLRLGLLLLLPLLWLGVVYLGSLFFLFLNAFWKTDPFTSLVVRDFTLANFQTLLSGAVYRTVTFRTVGFAVAVTLTCVVLAYPIAFYMAKVASLRMRGVLAVAVLMPLWASYLIKAYSWRLILSDGGVLDWLLEASSDLGGHAWTTFRRVILPMSIPAVIAGSIFTFALTLGDYIVPNLVSVSSSQFIGTVIVANVAQNLPLAAAYSLVPLTIIVIYLLAARRLGAFRAL